jgi:rhodanese-related sulfurtransferase
MRVEPAPVLLDAMLARARSRIRRRSATEAWTEMAAGAVLVDIRATDDRSRDGAVPGSVHAPRTVLEWRVCVESGFAHPVLVRASGPLILLCNEGYSSSLAAASLVELGFVDVGDVVDGFVGWCAAGLPVEPVGTHALDVREPGVTAG